MLHLQSTVQGWHELRWQSEYNQRAKPLTNAVPATIHYHHTQSPSKLVNYFTVLFWHWFTLCYQLTLD